MLGALCWAQDKDRLSVINHSIARLNQIPSRCLPPGGLVSLWSKDPQGGLAPGSG